MPGFTDAAGPERARPARLDPRHHAAAVGGGRLGLGLVVMSATAIRLDDLTLGYDRHPAVHHLSGSFGAGSLTAVVGPNGAGKTTLLKAIVGLLRPLAGRIELGSLHRSQIAYLPQQAEIDRSFPISVFDTVLLGLWARTGAFGRVTPAMREAADRALAAVG